MSKAIINGEVISGSSSYASAVEYTKEDGTKTTVQDELSELNSKLVVVKSRKTQELHLDISTPSTVTLTFDKLNSIAGLCYYQKIDGAFAKAPEPFNINGNKLSITYLNSIGTYTGNITCKAIECNEALTTVTKEITVSCTGYGYGYGKLTFDELSEVVAIKGFYCTGDGSKNGCGDVGSVCTLGTNEIIVIYDNKQYSAPHDETITVTVVGK